MPSHRRRSLLLAVVALAGAMACTSDHTSKRDAPAAAPAPDTDAATPGVAPASGPADATVLRRRAEARVAAWLTRVALGDSGGADTTLAFWPTCGDEGPAVAGLLPIAGRVLGSDTPDGRHVTVRAELLTAAAVDTLPGGYCDADSALVRVRAARDTLQLQLEEDPERPDHWSVLSTARDDGYAVALVRDVLRAFPRARIVPARISGDRFAAAIDSIRRANLRGAP